MRATTREDGKNTWFVMMVGQRVGQLARMHET